MDTDAVMVRFNASLEESLRLGREAAEYVSRELPPFILEFEKVDVHTMAIIFILSLSLFLDLLSLFNNCQEEVRWPLVLTSRNSRQNGL